MKALSDQRISRYYTSALLTSRVQMGQKQYAHRLDVRKVLSLLSTTACNVVIPSCRWSPEKVDKSIARKGADLSETLLGLLKVVG